MYGYELCMLADSFQSYNECCVERELEFCLPSSTCLHYANMYILLLSTLYPSQSCEMPCGQYGH